MTLNDYAGAQGASVSGFSFLGAVDSTLPFTIDARLKITSGSATFLYLLGSTATNTVAVGLSTSVLQVYSDAGSVNVALDATSFHDYQIAATPGSVVTVKVDGLAVYTGTGAWAVIDPHTNPNLLLFGDGTSGANGTAVLSSYSFTQNAAAVPEAGSLPLMVLGLAALLWRRRAAAGR